MRKIVCFKWEKEKDILPSLRLVMSVLKELSSIKMLKINEISL